MANFKQHLAFATLGTGILTTPLLGANLIAPPEALALWTAGSFGGVLPDIDSDNAKVLELMFGGLTLLAIGLSLNHAPGSLATTEKLTVHRGIFHSILSACFFAVLTCNLSYHFLNYTAKLAWLCGLFLMLGFILHLLLDEIFSVDFMNVELKRSFGSAFKITDYRNWKTSLAVLALTAGLFYFAPSPNPATSMLFSDRNWVKIKRTFLPRQWSNLRPFFSER
ncbi:MAG: metal-dependent hydrolase [Gammaproteobacteria bacterium]